MDVVNLITIFDIITSIVKIIIVDMSMEDIYRGKKVLITGTTGFLGKVLLEKFLFNLSCVDKIYIVIRSKLGSDLYERFKKEIVSSPCFDRIRKVHQNRFD